MNNHHAVVVSEDASSSTPEANTETKDETEKN